MGEQPPVSLDEELEALRLKARNMLPSAERLPTEVAVMHALAVWKAATLQDAASLRIEQATKRLATFTMWLVVATAVLATATVVLVIATAANGG